MLRFTQCFTIGFLFSLVMAAGAFAHNKMVIIPMVDDDVDTLPKPFTPLTKSSPLNSDYTMNTTTVVDNITKLEWQRQDDDITRNWNEAFKYCTDLVLDGKTNWRLPLIGELQSLVDYNTHNPAINAVVFPSTKTYYWSRSNFAAISGSRWDIFFTSGLVYFSPKAIKDYVRCVR